ncbi:hypothetical protein AB1Y20_012734 [Prymnesium parvum]|uniref:Nucleoporin Nup159/Nup146 N-terminal domain-containing protein n=1 Tax=Prymnesium parvum TaxID=97485 RepID=A0AB34ILM6_PRYPA
MADEQVPVDFVRFYGRRTTDQENDIRDCKVLNGNGFLHLRSDSSLLTVSNRFETLFLGGNFTLRWASLADLRLRCSPDRESRTDSVSLFHDVELPGGLEPFAMVLNKCESSLLVVGLSPCPTLLVFDVRAMLQGNTNPTVSHELHEGTMRQMQPHPTDSELVAILYKEGVISLARITGTTCAERRLTSDSQLRSITWELSGDALLCGTSRGEVIRYATDSGSKPLTLCGPPQGAQNGELSMLRSVDERFVLLVYEQPDDDPLFAFVDVAAAKAAAHQGSGASLQECGQACIPLGREEDGRPPPRAFHALTLPDWRMAIVCSSDSDEILCLGSRKPGDSQRWQRWILPDEEGPPTVPTFGEEFEEQFMMGFALDLTDPQQLVLIAGEERFPPSPVLWGYTSHGSLVAWTLIHKKAPAKGGEYSFMRVASPMPASKATPSIPAGASSVPSCGPTPSIAAGKSLVPLTEGVSSFASRPSVDNVPTFPLAEQQISNAGRASIDAQAQGRSKASHDVKRASKSSQAGEKSMSACQNEADMDSRTATAQYGSLGLPRDEQQAFEIAIAPMHKQMKELDELRERFQSVLQSCFGHAKAGSPDSSMLQDSENLVQKSETLIPSLLSRKEGTLALLELMQATHAHILAPAVNLLQQDEPDVEELHRLHLVPPLEDALDRFRSKLDGLNHMVERLHHRLSKEPARPQGLGQVLRDHADALILLQRRVLEVRKTPAIPTAAAPCEVLSVVSEERENVAFHDASTSASVKKIMAHIDTANKQGLNPLRYAASEGRVDTVQFLLRGEANRNLQAHERRDALQAALDKKATTVPTDQRPFDEIIQLLVASMPTGTSFQQRESTSSEAASECSSLGAAGSTVLPAKGKSSTLSGVSNAAMPALSTQRTPPPLVARGPPAVHTALCTSTAACKHGSQPVRSSFICECI